MRFDIENNRRKVFELGNKGEVTQRLVGKPIWTTKDNDGTHTKEPMWKQRYLMEYGSADEQVRYYRLPKSGQYGKEWLDYQIECGNANIEGEVSVITIETNANHHNKWVAIRPKTPPNKIDDPHNLIDAPSIMDSPKLADKKEKARKRKLVAEIFIYEEE